VVAGARPAREPQLELLVPDVVDDLDALEGDRDGLGVADLLQIDAHQDPGREARQQALTGLRGEQIGDPHIDGEQATARHHADQPARQLVGARRALGRRAGAQQRGEHGDEDHGRAQGAGADGGHDQKGRRPSALANDSVKTPI
jgi:hypothetical protein